MMKSMPFFDNRFFQRRSVRELRPDLRRAVVAVNTHTRAQAQQTLFRALRARHVVPLVAAYGAEQHTVGSYALIEHFLRQRVAPLIDGTTAHIDVCIMKGVSVHLCNFIQHAERFVLRSPGRCRRRGSPRCSSSFVFRLLEGLQQAACFDDVLNERRERLCLIRLAGRDVGDDAGIKIVCRSSPFDGVAENITSARSRQHFLSISGIRARTLSINLDGATVM